jgi:hypothetical protein
MKNIFFALAVIILASCSKSDPFPTSAPGQLYEYKVPPSATSAAITAFNNEHYVYLDTRVTSKNKLFVFLPGTSGAPGFYTLILKKAAALGYHCIGLMYPNNSDLYIAASTNPDNTAFGKGRKEIFEGTDQIAGVNVNADNCIKTRLIKLLQYQQAQHPTENWQQFLNGSDVNWSKVVIAGHSQGGGHAFYIAKQVSVDRAISFSSIDWNSTLNISAAWVTQPGATAVSQLYSFNHPLDEIFSYANVQTQLNDIGLPGSAVNIDLTATPYNASHRLISTSTPAVTIFVPNHNITCLDQYVPKTASADVKPEFVKCWDYLLGN